MELVPAKIEIDIDITDKTIFFIRKYNVKEEDREY